MKEEKWESEYLKSLGKKFLDDTFTLQKTPEQLEKELKEGLKNCPKKQAEEIFIKYTNIADLLRHSFGLYYNNVEFFEKKVLQVNSIISTSLMLEYRINDILFNRDLLSKDENDNNIDNNKILQYFNTIDKGLKGIKKAEQTALEQIKPLLKELKNEEQNSIMEQVINSIEEVLQNAEDMKQKTDKYIADTSKKITRDKEVIKELLKDEYFIGSLSKEKNLKNLFKDILITYIANDIIDGVREIYIKKYDVVISRTPRKKRIHCLNRGAYIITKGKIQDIMQLSLLNHEGNIIDDTTLKLFSIFIDIEAETKKAEYKKILKKYYKIASEKIEQERNKYTFLDIISGNTAEKVLQELRWCDFEEK